MVLPNYDLSIFLFTTPLPWLRKRFACVQLKSSNEHQTNPFPDSKKFKLYKNDLWDPCDQYQRFLFLFDPSPCSEYCRCTEYPLGVHHLCGVTITDYMPVSWLPSALTPPPPQTIPPTPPEGKLTTPLVFPPRFPLSDDLNDAFCPDVVVEKDETHRLGNQWECHRDFRPTRPFFPSPL